MTQTTKPEAVRVVVEIDQNGLVDIASDYPVELVLLNHHVREDDVDTFFKITDDHLQGWHKETVQECDLCAFRIYTRPNS